MASHLTKLLNQYNMTMALDCIQPSLFNVHNDMSPSCFPVRVNSVDILEAYPLLHWAALAAARHNEPAFTDFNIRHPSCYFSYGYKMLS